jgi:hypothetical protein
MGKGRAMWEPWYIFYNLMAEWCARFAGWQIVTGMIAYYGIWDGN